MITNANIIKTLRRVENGLPAAVIDDAITQVNTMLSEQVGSDNYATLDALPATDPIIEGGIVNGRRFDGLNSLISDMVVAILAHNNFVLTGFGTVEKKDEYSQSTEYFQQCKAKENHFRTGVIYLCNIMGWKYNYPESTQYTEKFFAAKK